LVVDSWLVKQDKLTGMESCGTIWNDNGECRGTDFEPISGSLQFAADERSQAPRVTFLDDNVVEGDEVVYLDLSGLSNADLERDQAILTIRDDE
jgi:hypothetical protein